MGFFDNYKDLSGGGKFLKSAEKQFLIENGITFQVTDVVEDPLNEFGARFVAFCVIPNEDGVNEFKKVGFPTGTGVDGRDALFASLKDYLAGDKAEPVFIKLEQPNRAILVVPSEEPKGWVVPTQADDE